MQKRWLIVFLFTFLFIAGCSQYFGQEAIGLGVTSTTVPIQKFDLNGNGEVDEDDFLQFSPYFNTRSRGQANDAGYYYTNAYDFNNDGAIDDTDYFLFSDNFGKKYVARVSKPTPSSFKLSENCLEVFPNFNGPVDERINLVFIGFNYNDLDPFWQQAKSLTDPDSSKSFFSYEPIKFNKDKFNVWYVPEIGKTLYMPTFFYNPLIGIGKFGQDYEDFRIKRLELAKACPIPANLKVVVSVFNSEFRDSAEPFSGETIYEQGTIGNLIFARNSSAASFFHEFNHAFLQLADEYTITREGWYKEASISDNCDVANSEIACPKWWQGEAF